MAQRKVWTYLNPGDALDKVLALPRAKVEKVISAARDAGHKAMYCKIGSIYTHNIWMRQGYNVIPGVDAVMVGRLAYFTRAQVYHNPKNTPEQTNVLFAWEKANLPKATRLALAKRNIDDLIAKGKVIQARQKAAFKASKGNATATAKPVNKQANIIDTTGVNQADLKALLTEIVREVLSE
jgi:hypothetical protein